MSDNFMLYLGQQMTPALSLPAGGLTPKGLAPMSIDTTTDPMTSKVCVACGSIFTRPETLPDWHWGIKKFCSKRCWRANQDPETLRKYMAAAMAKWRANNPERAKAIGRAWRLNNPDRVKEKSRRSWKKRNGNPEIVEQNRNRVKAWRVENPEKWQALNQNVQARRRARKRAVEIELFTLSEIYERDRGICGICAKSVDLAKATIDHIVPLSHHGPHTRGNVQIAHHSCNSARGAGRTPGQMRLGGEF